MECKYKFERKVNQILLESTFNDNFWESIYQSSSYRRGNFENDTFQIRSYCWNEEYDNDYHFYHKPSGLKIYWYKYPLRSSMSNMMITHEQFLTVLRDCFNSMKTGIYYDIEPWWQE